MNDVRGVSMVCPEDTVGYQWVNPYGLAKYVVLLTGISLVVLVPLDWAFPSGTRATQLGVENADRTIPQLVRLAILSLMIGYIALTGWDPGAYGFAPGRALIVLATYMFVAVPFYPSDLMPRVLNSVKSLPWIFAAIAAYRLALGGYLTAAILRYVAGIVVLLASAYTIPFCLDPGHRIGQNADGAMLLWCIPLLLLARPQSWAVALSGLASIAILVTVKRGTVLALLAGSLVYSAVSIRMSSREHKTRDFVIVILMLAAVAGGLLWQWENLRHRIDRDLSTGQIGSGRSSFYRVIIAEWYGGSAFSLLFGKGSFTVYETVDIRMGNRINAHSDWLEILHDMGLFGIMLFVYLHLRILAVVGQALRQREPAAPALAMGYCVFALRNVYSQCVVGTNMSIYFALLLGYAAAQTSRRTLREECFT
jgi:hypothetical protein